VTIPLQPDQREIERALRVFAGPDQVVEIRALNVQDGKWSNTVSGYYSDLTKAAKDAAQIRTASGVYLTMNPVVPDLLARCADRLKTAQRGQSTTDSDIVTRRWMLIDFDAKRASGISATDSEKAAALSVCQRVAESLASDGWPSPVAGDSGNGYHLYYRVDLPIESDLVSRCLKALHSQFSTTLVTVDASNGNPSRITKLPGTVARKGDSTPDRPHRLTRLLDVPEDLQVVPVALLEALAGPGEPSKATKDELPRTNLQAFDLPAFISRHNLDVQGPDPFRGGLIWRLGCCPWRESDGQSAVLVQMPSGAISATCRHATCPGSSTTGNHWTDLREMLDGPRSKPLPPSDTNGFADAPPDDLWEGTETTPAPQAPAPVGAPVVRPLSAHVLRGGALDAVSFPVREVIAEDWLTTASLGMVYAPTGVGKSWFTMEEALSLAEGRRFLGWDVTGPRRVLYVDGELPGAEIQRRFRLLSGGPLSDNLMVLPSEFLWLEQAPLDVSIPDGQARFNTMLADLEREGARPDLIIIDNLSTLTTADENDNNAQTVIMAWLMGLRHQQYAVQLVHHTGKSGDQRGASRRKDNLDYTISLTSAGTEGAGIRTEFVKWRCAKKPANNAWELKDNPDGSADWRQVDAPVQPWQLALNAIATEHPSSLAALGTAMDISKSRAQQHVDKLREKGFITATGMTLTTKGKFESKAVALALKTVFGEV